MKLLAGIVLALVLPGQALGSPLYERLQNADYMRAGFVATRTAQGVDFASKATIDGPGGRRHPRQHIEIEGPMRIPGADSLRASIDAVIGIIEPEIDTAYRQDENTRHGLNITTVDVNGVEVAFLSYRSAREADTFVRRAVIHTARGVYVAAMSLHAVPPRDRRGMYLETLVIDMVDSGELSGRPGSTIPSWLLRPQTRSPSP